METKTIYGLTEINRELLQTLPGHDKTSLDDVEPGDYVFICKGMHGRLHRVERTTATRVVVNFRIHSEIMGVSVHVSPLPTPFLRSTGRMVGDSHRWTGTYAYAMAGKVSGQSLWYHVQFLKDQHGEKVEWTTL